MEEELERTKELAAIMANMGQGTNTRTEPVEPERTQEEAPVKEAKLVASTVLKNECEWKKEIDALKEELVVQAALREK